MKVRDLGLIEILLAIICFTYGAYVDLIGRLTVFVMAAVFLGAGFQAIILARLYEMYRRKK